MTTKNKPPIPMKGPEKLSPEVIRDICENRGIQDAGNVMCKKHGISLGRVRNIWAMYYGGTTLADYKTGLKKQLPTSAVPQRDLNKRVIKTERAIYEAKEPKTMAQAAKADVGKRAAPIRKIPAKPVDLDLDNIAELDDNDAQIMAGELRAGNNSGELLSAIEQLIEHNQNISERTLTSLEKALEAASRRRGRQYDDTASDTDYSVTTDIETEDEDDSTAITRAQPTKTRGRPQRSSDGTGERTSEILESYEEPIEYNNVIRSPMGVREERNTRLAGPDQLGPQLREGPPRSSARAQPVYRTVRERPIDDSDEEQGYYSQAGGYEQTVPPAQYYASQGRVQSGNGHNNAQQYSQPQQGIGLHGGSRIGPGDAIQRHPWLKPRF